MNIGIIGAGNVGVSLAKNWARSGHQILLSYSRHPETLQELARSVGPNARVGTPAEAAGFGEAILLAVPWPAVDDALRAAGSLQGKILIDCTNPLKADLSGLTIGHSNSAAEEVARRAPGARTVKAFNTTGAENMAAPQFGAQRPVMCYCGGDAAAKTAVAGLAVDAGFEPLDAGELAAARLLEPLAMLWIHLAFAQKMGPRFAFGLLRR